MAQSDATLVSTLPDATLLNTMYDAFAAGDVATVLGACTEDITVKVAGENLIAGEYHGRDELLAWFMKLVELTAGTLSVQPREIFDNGSGTVVALCDISATRGEDARFASVQVWRFADGMATSFDDYYEDQPFVNAFWS